MKIETSHHELISVYLFFFTGSGKDLWSRTADKTERSCCGGAVVFWQVPRINCR